MTFWQTHRNDCNDYILTEVIVTHKEFIKPKNKNSASDFAIRKSAKDQIALFNKLSSKKVIFVVFMNAFIVVSLLSPKPAHASFFSGIVNMFVGNDAKAEEIEKNKVTHNSQTMQLLESVPALNPDMKKVKEITDFEIASDEALVVAPSVNNNYDLEVNSSEEKIDIYIVKKGDSLKSIIDKFDTSEKAIIAANVDIKKTDLLKVGQKLVIVPVKKTKEEKAQDKKQEEQDKKEEKEKLAKEKEDAIKEALEKKKQEAEKKKLAEDKKAKEELAAKEDIKKEEVVEETEKEVVKEEVKKDENKTSNTGKAGYIWPFPRGAGVVTQGLHDDQAYDFGAPTGTPIYAIQDGQVLIAKPSGYNGGYGLYVVINFDDGRQAIFGHMSRVASKAGDVVKQGDIIGYVGSTGKSTGPHVHIGFRGSLRNPYIGLPKGASSSSFK